jgi:hypothetical protein
MSLPLEQFCGSRLNYKVLHAALRLVSLSTIGLCFIIALSGRIKPPALETVIAYAFLCSPVALISVVVFESFWFVKTRNEQRALAIDWFFVIAALVAWGIEMVRIILEGILVSLWV